MREVSRRLAVCCPRPDDGPRAAGQGSAARPLHQQNSATSSFFTPSDYSTSVVRAPPPGACRSSILTVRVTPNPAYDPRLPGTTTTPAPTDSMLSIESFHTASGDSVLSIAGATEGGSTLRALPDVPGDAALSDDPSPG